MVIGVSIPRYWRCFANFHWSRWSDRVLSECWVFQPPVLDFGLVVFFYTGYSPYLALAGWLRRTKHGNESVGDTKLCFLLLSFTGHWDHSTSLHHV
jgi:hypothetical protein